ncbi:Pumilio-like protein [Chloropicon primus]|uniref:Pumilio-like protein n=1 Tax=Chloropicon primus TaxID=1764295 RepID=A0A5B8MHH8_9CHLO|nr:Pumilio-like protein [Chloropicon primus]UPQ98314.1 Pumilio-like protein [Chloropicon primus]|eukprot:QDZ19105.1 Pumilio-like protein [Chloropicon primus]
MSGGKGYQERKGSWKGSGKRGHDGQGGKEMSRNAQKRFRKDSHKQKRRPNTYPLIKGLLAWWEKLRSKKTSEKERLELVGMILKKSEGRLAELASLHSASRVVQSCLKFGNEEHKQQVISELKPKLLDLAQNQYGHFLVKKILAYSKEELSYMLNTFRGQIVALLRHPCGSSVVDDLYHMSNARQKEQMASEFYGPEVALLANLATDELKLSSLLERASSAQKAAILTHIFMKLSPILDKGLVDAHVVHFVIRELLQFAAPGAIQEAAQNLAGPHLLHLVHTKEGSEAAANVICASDAKSRKKIVKALKGHVLKCAVEDCGHIVLLSLLGVVDDTVLVDKIVVKELVPGLEELCLSKFGKRILLRLLAPERTKYIPKNVLEVLTPSEKVVKASNLKLPSLDDSDDEELELVEEDEDAKEQTVCKKPLETKCRELLFGSSKLALELIDVCTEKAKALMCSPHGSEVLTELVLVCENGISGKKIPEDKVTGFFDSLTAAVAYEEGDSVLQDFYATRMLAQIVHASHSDGKKVFAKKLWKDVAKDKKRAWKDTHAEKILRAFGKYPKSYK